MPIFVVIARGDEMPGSREDVAREAFARVAGPKDLLEIDGGHFGLLHYPGTIFDQVSSAQAAFLCNYLAPQAIAGGDVTSNEIPHSPPPAPA